MRLKTKYLVLISQLHTTAALNTKINEIPSITSLATTTVVTVVENKIPNVSKTDYNTKVSEIENKITINHDHDKYITTQEFNKLTSEHFTARLAQANLASKSDSDNLVKMTEFDDKLKNLNKNVISNKTKNVLLENELNELSKKVKARSTKGLTKDLINKFSILNGAKYFSSAIFRNDQYLYQLEKYIKYFSDTTRIDLWKSNGMSEKNIKNITKSNRHFAPAFVDHHVLPDINFNGQCLINNNISIPKKVIYIYILKVYIYYMF